MTQQRDQRNENDLERPFITSGEQISNRLIRPIVETADHLDQVGQATTVGRSAMPIRTLFHLDAQAHALDVRCRRSPDYSHVRANILWQSDMGEDGPARSFDSMFTSRSRLSAARGDDDADMMEPTRHNCATMGPYDCTSGCRAWDAAEQMML